MLSTSDEDLRRFAQQVGNRVVRRKLYPPISDARAAELLADATLLRAEFEARQTDRREPRAAAAADQVLLHPARPLTLATAPIGASLLWMFLAAMAVVVPILLGYTTGWRWFTEPGARDLFPVEDREATSRLYTSSLREVVARRGPDSAAARLADDLLARSDEFRALWDRHEVGLRPGTVKRYDHPVVGRLELHCQVLLDPEQAHVLLVYTAVPGTESHDRLRLLSVVAA